MGDDRGGDPAGWVDRHGDILYRYAVLRLRSPDLAADVVQETFLEALRARGTFAGRSAERTWLVGILKHKIVDQFRRDGRRLAREHGPEAWPDDAPAAGPEFDARGRWRVAPGAWSVEPGRDLERREFWEAIGLCLAKLPPNLADAFSLREVDGLDSDEVQDILGITPANLWARLHRARSLLRRCLESGPFGRPTSTAPAAPPARDPKGPASP